MEKELSDWKTQISNGNFQNIKQWLAKNVHSYGDLYDPADFIQRITGEELSVKPYINYLHRKFSKLYGF
jgi:carboxypeptidase Taq